MVDSAALDGHRPAARRCEVVAHAAASNALWCERVVRAAGATRTARDEDAWSSPRRTPDWYPDAVTLRPGVDAAELLARIDAGPGASIKDSWADLDGLAAGGGTAGAAWRVLLHGVWLHRDPTAGPPAPSRLSVRALEGPDHWPAWCAVHAGEDATSPLLGAPALTTRPELALLEISRVPGAPIGAVAVLSAGPRGVDVSNISIADEGLDPADVWAGVTAEALRRSPQAQLFAWEPVDVPPGAARAHDVPAPEPAAGSGWRSAGPLRVQLRS